MEHAYASTFMTSYPCNFSFQTRNVMDATAVSDGEFVVLKRSNIKTCPQELAINRMLSAEHSRRRVSLGPSDSCLCVFASPTFHSASAVDVPCE